VGSSSCPSWPRHGTASQTSSYLHTFLQLNRPRQPRAVRTRPCRPSRRWHIAGRSSWSLCCDGTRSAHRLSCRLESLARPKSHCRMMRAHPRPSTDARTQRSESPPCPLETDRRVSLPGCPTSGVPHRTGTGRSCGRRIEDQASSLVAVIARARGRVASLATPASSALVSVDRSSHRG